MGELLSSVPGIDEAMSFAELIKYVLSLTKVQLMMPNMM